MKDFEAELFDISLWTPRSLHSWWPHHSYSAKTTLPDGRTPSCKSVHKVQTDQITGQMISTPSGAYMKVANMDRSGLAAREDLVRGSGVSQLETALESKTGQCARL